jgi:hypothetical protein
MDRLLMTSIIDLIAKIPYLAKRLKITKGGGLAVEPKAFEDLKDQIFVCDHQNPDGLVFWFDEKDGKQLFHIGQARRP